MGYCIDATGNVLIKEGEFHIAIDCFKKLMHRDLKSGPHGFSWVSSDRVINFLESDYDEKRKLKYVLREFRYGFDCFLGEKWGDDEFLWEALAPAVDDGCTIEYHGEDGHKWRYLFKDGEAKQQNAIITWE